MERSHSDRAGAAPGAGFLHLVFPAMLLLTALDVALSGRDLTQAFAELERSAQDAAPSVRHPVEIWGQRAVSVLLVAASLHRIGGWLAGGRLAPAVLLTAAFAFYWATTIAWPALFGANPRVSHEYAYPLLFGLACTLVDRAAHARILEWLRNALFIFMLAGLALVAVQPQLVIDASYSQGLLRGLPRFGGLAQHPVMMGMLAQLALLVLWARPFPRPRLQQAAWVLGLGVLLVAQSKTAWLAFLVGGCCMWLVQRGPQAAAALGDPRRSSFGVGVCLAAIAGVLAMLVAVLVGDLPGRVADFLDTGEGSQLTSLTGRDRIWVVALEEWQRHPVTGWGLSMWNSEFRQDIGMPQATHAHNQLLDTLGRAGLVGAAGLAVYAIVLLALAVRHASASGGLPLAMMVTLVMLGVSEVPLLLVDYGSHVLVHNVLLVTLAAAAAGQVRRRPARAAPLPARPPQGLRRPSDESHHGIIGCGW